LISIIFKFKKQPMNKYFSLLVLIIISFVSCDDNVEINLSEKQLLENQPNFQVDFDNQTFVADYVEASIVDGVTILKGTKLSTKEVIVIVLNKDQVGEYTLSPNDNIGSLLYKKDTDDTFNTSPTAFAGRIDLNEIDLMKNKLFGAFSFIGMRLIPLLDDQGQSVLDDDGQPVYTEEIKHFTNGLFSNIDFSLTESVDPNVEPEPEPTNDTFFMKIDGEEFVETTLNAQKIMVDGVAVIQIQATNDGSNHVFKLQMPADVVFGSSHILQATTTNPASESTVNYHILSLTQEFAPYAGDITIPILRIISHDNNTNKIVGTFEFSAERLNGGSETMQFTEGAFSVTYTE